MSEMKTIREQGIGSNFKVLNPKDGYRKDNSVWFGECANCGERVSNSVWHGVWHHTIETPSDFGSVNRTKLDYCPA